jgi:hypothetical protein
MAVLARQLVIIQPFPVPVVLEPNLAVPVERP